MNDLRYSWWRSRVVSASQCGSDRPQVQCIVRLVARWLIAMAALGLAPSAYAGDAESVHLCFQDYRSAILDRRGEAAAGLVTAQTIGEYQRYVGWALSADRKTLESLSLVNRFQVFLLRQRIPAETLKRLDGRSAFVYAVDRDWIGKDSVVRTTLGTVTVAGNRASAEVLVGGQRAPHRFQFSKENGLWRFDLVQLLPSTDQALKAVARQRGLSEDEFVFSLIESVSGRRVEPTIWVPVQKRAGAVSSSAASGLLGADG
jgi:hypothetical protein